MLQGIVTETTDHTKTRKKPLAVEIGKRLQQTRREAGQSVEDVARDMGCDRQTVATWESGNAFAPVWKLKKLAEMYHVTIEYLVTGRKPGDAPNDVIAYLPDDMRRRHLSLTRRPALAQLVDSLDDLTDEELEAVYRLVTRRSAS